MPDTLNTFAHRVEERTAGGGRLLVMPTPAEQVVAWRGSFMTCPDFAAGDELVQELAVALLDKGTRKRDRFALARVLEDRGAQLSLMSDGLRVEFSARALKEDVPAVMEVLAEMLQEPAFDEEEFDKAKARVAAMLQREMDDTSTQAESALAQQLYPADHPNYGAAPEALLRDLEAVTREKVAAYHAQHFGARDLILAAAGDVETDVFAEVVQEALGDWPDHAATPSHAAEAAAPEAGRRSIAMPDKANVHVCMGHPLTVRRSDDAYLPLYLGNYVLGGNFSARLMTAIRDEQGLTYGIGSSLAGMSADYDGHWEVSVTLSHDRLEEGVAATRAEVERFAADGITAEELAEKKTTITGSFKVGLATTRQLARTLLLNAERGFDVGYLDRFPALIEALTLEEVNGAIGAHFRPERFCTAAAGVRPEKAAAAAASS